MSNFLSQVSHSNEVQTGVRTIVFGVEGVGKTSLACGAPGALLIPLETGYAGISVKKIPMLKSFDDVMAFLAEVTTAAQKKQFAHKTLVFDSATALEKLIHEKTIQSDPGFKPGNSKGLTMESALGGYGKAYERANELFGNFLTTCDDLINYGGLNVVLTCHAFASKVLDPSCGEYNTWEPLLHSPKNNKTYGKREMAMQWCDICGFLYEPMFVSKTSDNFSQGISSNKGRVLGLERTPAYVAKNRFGVRGEVSIPKEQSWNYLAQAIYSASGRDLFNRELV